MLPRRIHPSPRYAAFLGILLLFSTACVDGKTRMYRGMIENKGHDFSEKHFLVFGTIGKIELLDWYIKAGIDVNARSDRGTTALMNTLIGPRGDEIERLRMLIDAGADVNVEAEQGMTALKAAIINDNAKAVRLLIDSGADVSESGRTSPLRLAESHVSIGRRSDDIVTMLRDAGAVE